jgi:branched-chain amino acid transport system permease protein
MFYRENGQFKTSYRADQQIFPITQDRWAVLALIGFAAIGVPLLADDYLKSAILVPFLILSLAALGVNILVGYCGQISLGSGGFMAVGAYAAYNTFVRIDGMPLIVALLSGGFFATLVGIVFGVPSLRVKGLYLAVATLAAQFFCDWAFLRVSWFTNNSSSGSVAVSNLSFLGWGINTPTSKYLFCLGFLVVFALMAKNLVRGHIGRSWMAMRDMDVAAEVIGIRPLYAKLSAFAVSSFYAGVSGALWGFVHLGAWEPLAFNINIIGGSHPTRMPDGDIHNVAYVCLRDGSIHAQEKIHPTPNEAYWWNIKGGDSIDAIPTDCGPIGVLICYDAEFPELARRLVDEGARIIFVPFCTDSRQGYMRVRYCSQARAIENQCFVVLSGNVGNLL